MAIEIVALDPGRTTGIATLDDNGKFNALQMNFEDYTKPHETLTNFLRALNPTEVIYEAFHFRQGMNGVVFKGVEYIGVIELYAQMAGKNIIKITPSEGKGFWNNGKLETIGLWRKNLPHGMDALRVLLRYKMRDAEFMADILPRLKNN